MAKLSPAKFIHTMIRVFDEKKSLHFYQNAFGMEISHRLDFEKFTLIYLRNEANDFEIELTVNKGQESPYTHGDGYGHVAVAVDDLDATHSHFVALGFSPNDIVEFAPDGDLIARFFFVQDPDGYKIEVLQKHGHYV